MTKHYGRTPTTTPNTEAWDKQDHSKSWVTAEETIDAAFSHARLRIKKLIADEVRDGITEYMAAAESAVMVDEQGNLQVGVRVWNEEAAIIVHVPLKTLLVSVLKEISAKMDTKDGQIIFRALHSIGEEIVALAKPRTPPAPQPGVASAPMTVNEARRRVGNGRTTH